MVEFSYATKRLVLRDWREDDWPEFWEGTNTPTVMRWLGGVLDEEAKAAGQQRMMSYHKDHGHTFWVVERQSDNAVLGFCGLKRCNQQGGPLGAMEVGWRLRENAWGMGYAKEAAIASLDLAFDRFGSDEVIAITVKGNTASWGLMERLGMERREDLDFEDSEWDANDPVMILYSMSRSAWQTRNG